MYTEIKNIYVAFYHPYNAIRCKKNLYFEYHQIIVNETNEKDWK